MTSYGMTLTFDNGSSTYGVRGYPSRNAALWAAFRGVARSYKNAGLTERQRIRAARRDLMSETADNIVKIARRKLST